LEKVFLGFFRRSCSLSFVRFYGLLSPFLSPWSYDIFLSYGFFPFRWQSCGLSLFLVLFFVLLPDTIPKPDMFSCLDPPPNLGTLFLLEYSLPNRGQVGHPPQLPLFSTPFFSSSFLPPLPDPGEGPTSSSLSLLRLSFPSPGEKKTRDRRHLEHLFLFPPVVLLRLVPRGEWRFHFLLSFFLRCLSTPTIIQ